MISKNKIFAFLVSLMLAMAMPSAASASRVLVKAKLDSTILMMGKMTNLSITVDQEKGVKGHFPIFKELKENGIVGLCGDSVELRAPSKADTVENGGMLIITYSVPVQSFDSGYYKLPEIAFVTGRDTARSNSVALKVVPVVVDSKTPINDYANVSDPENSSIFDRLPDWVVEYWWILLILILLAVAAFILWRRYRKEGTILKKKPEPTPYEKAIAGLRELKEKKLWEQGMEKEYFTDLTDILRNYLYGRFGINAMEMTSRQILGAMKNNAETKDKRNYIRQILNMADFVKFAKVRPLPDDNIASYDNALKFVEETKPLPVPEDDAEEADKGKGKAKKSARSQKAAKGKEVNHGS